VVEAPAAKKKNHFCNEGKQMNVLEKLAANPTAVGYFDRPEMNCSGMKLLLQSPAHFKHAQTSPRIETKAMQIGTAVHTLTLEPVEFTKNYAVAPSGINKRTNAGKEEWAALEAEGRVILGSDEFEQIRKMSEAVRTHGSAATILKFGMAELEIYTEIEGIGAKAKLDWYRKGIIADLKTTEDASPDGFHKAVAKYQYAMQAAWYLDCANAAGMDANSFIFIAVEKTAPYLVGIYELCDEDIERGRREYQRALAIYRRCLKTGEYAGYSNNIETLKPLPTWAFSQTN
jgi:exodeoxyribonuclease VIII